LGCVIYYSRYWIGSLIVATCTDIDIWNRCRWAALNGCKRSRSDGCIPHVYLIGSIIFPDVIVGQVSNKSVTTQLGALARLLFSLAISTKTERELTHASRRIVFRLVLVLIHILSFSPLPESGNCRRRVSEGCSLAGGNNNYWVAILIFELMRIQSRPRTGSNAFCWQRSDWLPDTAQNQHNHLSINKFPYLVVFLLRTVDNLYCKPISHDSRGAVIVYLEWSGPLLTPIEPKLFPIFWKGISAMAISNGQLAGWCRSSVQMRKTRNGRVTYLEIAF
jgi:hypothetical protein